MYKYVLVLSIAIPRGLERAALVARPPSPLDPKEPEPAKVLTIDDADVIFLTL